MSQESDITVPAPSKIPDWFVPDYPELKGTDNVGKAAVEGQVMAYPKVVRSQTDPAILNQEVGNISFMLFKEPRKLRTGKPVYGFFKLRGNWPNETDAKRQAAKIIREIDSKYPVLLAPVGHWLPITEENAIAKDMLDVRMKDDEIQLRDQAVKDKQEEERRIMREIREREDELKSGDIYDDPTSLTYYSMRRVTEMKLVEARDAQRKQIASIEEKIDMVRRELKTLEKDHPQYGDEWLDCYNAERRKVGIPDFNPGEDTFREYNEYVLEESPEEDA